MKNIVTTLFIGFSLLAFSQTGEPKACHQEKDKKECKKECSNKDKKECSKEAKDKTVNTKKSCCSKDKKQA